MEGKKAENGIEERGNRKKPRLNSPSAKRKAVFNRVNIEEREIRNEDRVESRKIRSQRTDVRRGEREEGKKIGDRKEGRA